MRRSLWRTAFPDLDRPIARSRDDLGPIGGKRHRRDAAAVGVRLLAREAPIACQTRQPASVLAKRRRNLRASGCTRIPDLEPLVVRSGHDPGPVRGERHRRDPVAVGVRHLAQQPQRGCKASQPALV